MPMVALPESLEDSFADIVAKAARGLGIPQPSLPAVSDISSLHALAEKLQLQAHSLVEAAQGSYLPSVKELPPSLHAFATPFGDMLVNSYLVVDPVTNLAAVFDTGADCTPLLSSSAKIEKIFLTHIHGDHIFDLDRLMEKTGAAAFVSAREPLEGATPFADGTVFSVGHLRIETRRTSGHARGGTTYVVHGLAVPVAFVGDALFAGSMGGTKSPAAYREAIETALSAIFSLPDQTLLCPGHGPITTVALERQHNPFFASRARH